MLKRVACCALRSSILKADAALAGGRPPNDEFLIKAPEEMIPILELI